MEKAARFFSEVFRDCDWREEKIAIALGYHGKGDDHDNTTMTPVIYDNVNTLVWELKNKKLPKYAECYFSVATVHYESKSRTAEDLHSRNCLVFDFDHIEAASEIYERFKKIGLFCHCLINSGHGYHAYVFLKQRIYGEKLKDLQQLNACYVNLLDADAKANNLTQLLRIPNTFNCKDSVHKLVCVVNIAEDIRPYDFDMLFSKMRKIQDAPVQVNKMFTEFPPCISSILESGVQQGDRNWVLRRLVSFLKNYTDKTDGEIFDYAHQFGRNCIPPMSEGEINYQTNYILKRSYMFFGCSHPDSGIQKQIDCYCDKQGCKYSGITVTSSVHLELPERLCSFHKNDKKALCSEAIAIIATVSAYGKITSEKLQDELSCNGELLCGERKLKKILKELHKQELLAKTEGVWMPGAKLHKNSDRNILLSYDAIKKYVSSGLSGRAFEVYLTILKRFKQGQDVLQQNLSLELGITQAAVARQIAELEQKEFLVTTKDYTVNAQHPVNIYTLLI